MKDITGGSYIRLIKEPTKVYKVTSVNEQAKLIDATDQNRNRISLNLMDVELADNDDIFTFEDNSSPIYEE